VIIQGSEYKTPGQLIQSLLDSRGWTQRILAIVLAIDETGLNKIVAGKRAVDAELALGLSQVFGVAAEEILDLQKEYELAMARLLARPDPRMAMRASLFGELPVPEMIRRRWLPGVVDIRDVEQVEAGLCHFFGVQSVEEIQILPHAAKKTNIFANVTPPQLAWLYRVKQLAEDMMVAKFSEKSLLDAVQKLETLRVSADAARKVSRIMMESGIRFVIVETLPSTKIDGVCFWLNNATRLSTSCAGMEGPQPCWIPIWKRIALLSRQVFQRRNWLPILQPPIFASRRNHLRSSLLRRHLTLPNATFLDLREPWEYTQVSLLANCNAGLAATTYFETIW